MRNIKWLLSLLMLLLFSLVLRASGDILVHFNFYEGIRHKEKIQPAVASSYFLKPLAHNHLVFNARQTREKAKLKRVYNLKDVKPLTREKWAWQKGQQVPGYHIIVITGHVFRVQLTPRKQSDGFRLEVIKEEKPKPKEVLDTEISLPEENTAIFGFEDSRGKIYFLSFYREKNPTGTGSEPIDVSRQEVPELIKRVDPVYPPEAVKKQEEGMVIMEVVVDKQGNVADVNITSGENPVLSKAAVEAVRQWKYRPYLKDGVPKPVKFIVVLDFYFY